jgi:hypothetical protein
MGVIFEPKTVFANALNTAQPYTFTASYPKPAAYFKYLVATAGNQNLIHEEIQI